MLGSTGAYQAVPMGPPPPRAYGAARSYSSGPGVVIPRSDRRGSSSSDAVTRYNPYSLYEREKAKNARKVYSGECVAVEIAFMHEKGGAQPVIIKVRNLV